MIRVLGGPKRLCDGITRRDLLWAGSLGMLGLGAGRALAAQKPGSSSGLPGFGQARSCILLFLYGSPSQLETFDPKPDAPLEIRGALGTISSSIPGVSVCEGLPRLAQVLDKLSILRAVSHPYPVHGVAYATTGIPRIEIPMELNPRDPAQWPFIGSVVDYVDEQGRRPRDSALPGNLVLPWAFSSQRVGETARAGPYGGFLGPRYDPISAEFVGKGTRNARKTLQEMVWEDAEPYRGITPESRFRLGVAEAGPTLSIDRMKTRRGLLEQLESLRKDADSAASRSSIDRNRSLALELLSSRKVREAFDLGQEPDHVRDLYGMTLFGQAALTARRLVEAGARFTTVFWDEYGLAGTGWDTHWDHFPRMKDELLPGLDQTLAGLLIDLDRRGLLETTLVVVLSEHGRTPKLANVQGGGRDHWSRCYSVALAGGGIGCGRVIGRSDRTAGDPLERRVSPKDVLATMYHLLGIDPAMMIRDQQGRPLPIVPDAAVIPELLA